MELCNTRDTLEMLDSKIMKYIFNYKVKIMSEDNGKSFVMPQLFIFYSINNHFKQSQKGHLMWQQSMIVTCTMISSLTKKRSKKKNINLIS